MRSDCKRLLSRLLAASLFWVMPFAHGSSPTGLTVLVAGDSLSAEYGIARGRGWVQLVQDQLKQDSAFKKTPVNVVNASISGETTSGGRTRLPALLAQHQPQFVVIELGANDALRGLPVEQAERALDDLLGRLAEKKLPVLLAGMRAPPNLGADYGAAFDGMYARLAAKHAALLYPFFLDGVAADPALNQADGLHPNGKGVDVIVMRILPRVEDLVNRVGAK